MIEKRQWHEELAEAQAIEDAAFEDELSLSAAADGETDNEEDEDAVGNAVHLDALRPIALPKERMNEYQRFFFHKTTHEGILNLLEDMADVTHRINAFFSFMRSIMLDGRKVFQIEQDKEQLSAFINGKLSQVIEAEINSASPSTEAVNNFLTAFCGQHFQVVTDSIVYKNGLDVALTGSLRSATAPSCFFGANSYSSVSHLYQNSYSPNERFEAWSCETCINVTRAAKEINEFLFGPNANVVTNKVRRRTLPLSTKISEIVAIFERHVGVKLERHIVGDFSPARANTEQFISLELMRYPTASVREAVDKIRRQQREQTTNAGLSHEDEDAFLATQLASDPSLPLEAELFNPKVLTSLRFTFEADLAQFITQTPNGRAPSKYAMHTWFAIWATQILRVKNSRVNSKESGGIRRMDNASIPRYVLQFSALPEVSKSRKQRGYATESSRANEDGLFISTDGRLEYRPDSSVRDSNNLAQEYDQLCSEFYELTSKHEVSARAFVKTPSRGNWNYIPQDDYDRMVKIVKRMEEFNGAMVTWDWDYGISAVATDIPGITKTSVEIGCKKPDDIAIADYLGMNLTPEASAPVQKSFATAMYLMTNNFSSVSEVETYAAGMYGAEHDVAAMVSEKSTSTVAQILYLYSVLVARDGKFMTPPELAKAALANLGMSELPETGRDAWSFYGREYLNRDGSPAGYFASSKVHSTIYNWLRGVFASVLRQTAGLYGSHIYNSVVEEHGRYIGSQEMQDYIREHEDYFVANKSPMHDFDRVFRFFGGQILKLVIDQINSLSASELLNLCAAPKTYLAEGRTYTVKGLEAKEVMQRVKPAAVMLGKYVPNKETFFAKARAQMDSIGRNPDFTTDELKVPGLQEGRAVFPHQLDTQSYLRKSDPPPFAVLSIAPGGGKTGIGTMDIAALAGELQQLGVRVRPLVIAPDNLIKTWCDDIKYFLGDSWNAVPISTNVMNRWGPERLQQLMDNAPPNTIFITGIVFMSNAVRNVSIGGVTVKVSGHLELIKRLAPNYIIIDESHKLKNPDGLRHRIVKSLTTATFVKWLRIATGTLMPNKPVDLAAQVSLYSPHIFRQGELSELGSEAAEHRIRLGDSDIPIWQADTPERARAKLGRYAAVVFKKKKEWAYMLPVPVESFHAITLVDSNASGPEAEDQKLHEQLYETVLQQTVEAVEKLRQDAIKRRSKIVKEGAEVDDTDTSMLDESGKGNKTILEDMADLADAGIDIAALERHFQRFEQMLIAPEHDPAYESIFGGRKYTSRKAKFIANLAVKHFHPEEWSRDGTIFAEGNTRPYREYDMVQYKGTWYLARKFDRASTKPLPLPDETIGVSPDKLPEFWKPEPEGKVIIITRYNNSAKAVFSALPPEYQKMATVFTGDEENKWRGFELFKTNPNVKILIANEQGMSEGHNLQMASRIIRAECPWGPGEMEQTNSRIFRPDPKGYANGELTRDIVYLDWVLTDNSMEVAKQARLISKIYSVSRVEESENERYQNVFNKFSVPTHEEMPELSMSVEALKNRASLRQEPFSSMVQAYAALNGVIRSEFNDMRESAPAGLLPVEAQPSLPGSAKVQAPFVPNQDIPDPQGWNPVSVERYLASHDDVRSDPNKLIGLNVVTDQGTGKIVSFRRRSVRGRKGNTRDVSDDPITSVVVKLMDPPLGVDQLQKLDLGVTFVVTRAVSTKEEKQFFDVTLGYTQKDLKDEERRERKARELEEAEAEAEAIRRKQEEAEAKRRIRAKEAADKRQKNVAEGKPINQGVKYDKDADKKIRTTMTPVVEGDNSVTLHPAYFHGYLTLEGEFDSNSVNLKKLGFKFSGEYAFVTVKRYNNLAAIFDYLEEHFELSSATEKRLGEVQDAFEPGKRGLYKMELAPVSTLPMFFAARKKIVTNRREVRVYPVFMADTLILAVDTATSPAILKHIGKSIPGAATKWQKHPGHWHFFAQGKTEVRNKIAEVKRNGYNVVNEKEALKELASIAFRKQRSSSK